MYSKLSDCKVVWSSSWRNTTKKSKLFIEGLYYQCGLPSNSFIGYTPYLPNMERRNEIELWLDTFYKKYNITKCAIIDDRSDANLQKSNYLDIQIKFFQTNFKFGLTEEISNEILNFLKK